MPIMVKHNRQLTRHGLLKRAAVGTATAVAAPLFVEAEVFGANDRITMGCIGDPEANCWLDREKRQPRNLT